MTFNNRGVLVSARVLLHIQGSPQFDTKLIEAAAKLHSDKVGAIAKVGAEILNNLSKTLDRYTDHGGRRNFGAVIRHNMHYINASVQYEAGTSNVPLHDGSVLREYSRAEVYVIFGGAKFWVPNPQVLQDLYGGWGNVKIVLDGALAGLPVLPRSGTILREQSNPAVYLIEERTKRYITSPSVLQRYGGASAVRVVPNGSLGSIPTGAPVF